FRQSPGGEGSQGAAAITWGVSLRPVQSLAGGQRMSIDDTKLNAVFIDATVGDLQDLLDGLKPGEQAFLIHPGGDGIEQIAAILASSGLTNLSSIAIVGHGSAGAIGLGSTVLDDSDLSQHAAALARIGSALAADGQLELFACDVASGTIGQ